MAGCSRGRLLPVRWDWAGAPVCWGRLRQGASWHPPEVHTTPHPSQKPPLNCWLLSLVFSLSKKQLGVMWPQAAGLPPLEVEGQ